MFFSFNVDKTKSVVVYNDKNWGKIKKGIRLIHKKIFNSKSWLNIAQAYKQRYFQFPYTYSYTMRVIGVRIGCLRLTQWIISHFDIRDVNRRIT